MESVRLDAVNSRIPTMELLQKPGNEFWRSRITLAIPEVSVSTDVWEMGTELARFVRDLADDWSGFEGSKVRRIEGSKDRRIEGDLTLTCQHDGGGTVVCKVTLRQPEPPELTLEAILDFGAGAHLERLADELEAFMPY